MGLRPLVGVVHPLLLIAIAVLAITTSCCLSLATTNIAKTSLSTRISLPVGVGGQGEGKFSQNGMSIVCIIRILFVGKGLPLCICVSLSDCEGYEHQEYQLQIYHQ